MMKRIEKWMSHLMKPNMTEAFLKNLCDHICNLWSHLPASAAAPDAAQEVFFQGFSPQSDVCVRVCVSVFVGVSSYLHCEWATEQQLVKDKRIQQKIKRFKMKQAQRALFFADVRLCFCLRTYCLIFCYEQVCFFHIFCLLCVHLVYMHIMNAVCVDV